MQPRPQLPLTIILLTGLLLRLAWILHQPTDPAALSALPDQQEYFQLGRHLLAGDGLQFTDPRFNSQVWAYRTPGYPAFIAACDANLTAIRIAQAVLDTSTILAVYLLARTWLPPRAALAAAALMALNPQAIYFCGLILSETLFVAMLAWAMTLLTRTTAIAAMALLLAALSILVRPSILALPLLLAIAAKRRKSLPLASLAAALTVLVLLPWAARNHQRLGTWVWTTTNSGITRYDGFNPIANGGSDQSFVNQMPQLASMTELQRSEYLNTRADDFIRANPARCITLTLLKIARLWSPVPLSRQFSRPLYVAAALAYDIPLMALTLAGLFAGTLPRWTKLFLLTPALYLTVIHAASVSSLRYRLPAEPLMAIVAVSGIKKLSVAD